MHVTTTTTTTPIIPSEPGPPLPLSARPERPPHVLVAWLVCVAMIAAMAYLRLDAWRSSFLPVAYGVPLVLNLWLRNRAALWTMAAGFVVIAAVKYLVILPSDPAPPVSGAYPIHRTMALGLVLADTFVIAAVVHAIIGAREALERGTNELIDANRALAAREVEIARQNEELRVRRREAEESSVRKTRFLAAVSHDIRTPANAITLMAELLRRSAANPETAAEVPELADELHASATALVNLLGDVLDLARLDSGRFEMQESEFALGELLAEQQRRLLPLAREKGLSLNVVAPDPGLRLRADRMKLARVIDNLVGNAIKFTAAGEVRVEAHREPDGATTVRVADTGIGIATDAQRHIFDEFFQLSNPERDRTKGTGLGLTICHRLVDAMGGSMAVDSEPGRGSTFTITLPAAAALPNG